MASGLWPKEHGAYFQLALPLLTAAGLALPSLAGALLMGGAVCAFLGHEPLLVALGHRGKRARHALGQRAGARAAVLVTLALGGGVTGLVLAGWSVAWTAAIPLTAIVVVALLIGRKQEKTFGGEVVVGIAFASSLVPVAMASGVDADVALTAAAVWAVAFVAGTAAVHAVVGDFKKDRPWARPVAIAFGIACTGAAIAPVFVTAAPNGLSALAPMAVTTFLLLALKPHPRHLRRVGWSLAATHALTLGLLLFTL